MNYPASTSRSENRKAVKLKNRLRYARIMKEWWEEEVDSLKDQLYELRQTGNTAPRRRQRWPGHTESWW